MAKEIINLSFEVSLFVLRSYFLYALKSYDIGPTALLPLPSRRRAVGFIALKYIFSRPGLNQRTVVPVAGTLFITQPRQLHASAKYAS
jgi:hypothetical protein